MSLNLLSKENKACLQAFADGVNAYVQESPLLPREFYTHAIGTTFEPWKPIDSLAILKYVNF